MAEKTVLVVDDDDVARKLLQEVLEKEGFQVTLAASGEEALKIAEHRFFSIVVSDIRMLDLDGLDVLKFIKNHHPRTVVILMTAFGSLETAVEAIKEGAFDYISKPFQIEAFKSILKKAFKQAEILQGQPASVLLPEPIAVHNNVAVLVGSSPKMLDIFKTIALAAISEASVLIRGESGTGKELIARAIHANSNRRQHKFVAINCGALTEALLESELFGHVKGSFTGAQDNRKGLFEEAQHGTVFLDEIGDISQGMQVKLLRVLQEGEIRSVGSNEVRTVNVRIIAATHRDLNKLVAEGKFREDLLYRLKVIALAIPPLRERLQDIPALVNEFLPKYAKKNGKKISHLTKEALQALMSYSWPGNVRELQNTIERAIALARTHQIDVDDLPPEIMQTKVVPVPHDSGASLEDMEKQHILQVLQQAQYNKSRAAEILGIDRATLYRKAQKYGIDLREK